MDKVKLEEFYQDLHQNSFVGFNADSDASRAEVLREQIGDYLEEDGDLGEVVWVEYTQKDMFFSGYSFDSERGLLTIVGDHFFYEECIQTLTKDQYERDFRRLRKFFLETTNYAEPLYKDMAPGDAAAGASKFVLNAVQENKIKRVVFLLLTNGVLTRNTSTIPSDVVNGLHCDYHVYDLRQMYQTVLDNQTATIEVQLAEYGMESGLSCLNAINDQNGDFESYLVVVPGVVLARIYDKYGQKLLEQNVRTFLQLRGNTNKNMLATLKTQPERFFIYNNGLTCTASDIELAVFPDGLRIKSIEGLQIVNGGQTSSVIYKAYSEGIDLSKVFVQMKLSVIKNGDSFEEVVSSVARYANTQNPIKESDFFSSNPYNKGFYEASRKCWTPISHGRQYKTLWFYERTRGQYLNEKAKYEKEGRGKEFEKKYPKNQLVDKNILAKVLAVYNDRPFEAANQKNAFSSFSSYVSKLVTDGKTEFAITPQYFMETIGKIILVNETDKLIIEQSWSKAMRSIRAYIKAYSVALLCKHVKEKGLVLNFQNIWDRQMLSNELIEAVLICVNVVYEEILKKSDAIDLREKLRSSSTWESFKQLHVFISSDLLDSICISKVQREQEEKEEKKNQKELSEAKKQEVILGLTSSDWFKLLSFLQDNPGLCTAYGAISFVEKMSRRIYYPTRKQEINSLFDAVEIGKKHGIIRK